MPVLREQENSTTYPIAALLKRVLNRFRDSLDEKLRPFGVTSAQLHLLAALDREPGVSGARLARSCMVTPQTTQVLLRGIEANGWIHRRKHPENERILQASLTPSGERILARSRIVIGEIYSRMLDGLAPEEVQHLATLLSRCELNLELVRASAAADGQDGKVALSRN
jgi:MarR family transcriptional regulator, organic hydroperoxide resistance regulator